MSGTWKAPPGWKALRKAVFRRDGRSCWRCGAYATTVDHVVPVVLGGSHDLSNLRPCCAHHNFSFGASVGNRLRPRRVLSPRQRQAIALKQRRGAGMPASRSW
jgi:5-methylcytosine-specific restriction endonuclease McrA